MYTSFLLLISERFDRKFIQSLYGSGLDFNQNDEDDHRFPYSKVPRIFFCPFLNLMFLLASLDDVKTNSQTDSNAAKTIALEHLGVIGARI